MTNNLTGKKGFTFVELLIVMVIIGVLVSIAIPLLASSRQKAYNSAAYSDLKNLRTLLESYYAEKQQYP